MQHLQFLTSKINQALSVFDSEKHISTTKEKEGVVFKEETGIIQSLSSLFQSKSHSVSTEYTLLPWEQVQDSEQSHELQEQILAISQDDRNFTINPPSNTSFIFNMNEFYPIATRLLALDDALSKKRFELVPSKLNEETFFRNYAYRIHLITSQMGLSSPIVSISNSKEQDEIKQNEKQDSKLKTHDSTLFDAENWELELEKELMNEQVCQYFDNCLS